MQLAAAQPSNHTLIECAACKALPVAIPRHGSLASRRSAATCQHCQPPTADRPPCLLQDHDMPSAAELAGAKVKHTADELEEGETMILTLGEQKEERMIGGEK